MLAFLGDWELLFDQFWSFTIGGLTSGSIYALVALGYTMVYGVLRLINFANSEIFMLGTLGALFATKWLGIEPGADSVQTGIVLVGVFLVCLVAGDGVQRGALRLRSNASPTAPCASGARPASPR